MLSSNQILAVSGTLDSDDLKKCLEFALRYSGYDKELEKQECDRCCILVYQITEDGKYCIGWGFETPPKGWNEYPFSFDIDTVSKISYQHLETYPVEKDTWDGSYVKGFYMKCIDEYMGNEDKGIINPFYGIVYFEPYTCYFSK